MDETYQRLVTELSEETGVNQEQVISLLSRLNFDKSFAAAQGLVSADRVSNLQTKDMVVAINFDKALIMK